jgi:hypothetical protein
MTAYTYPPDNFSRRLEEMMDFVHDEIQGAVAYADAVIVPKIRRESSEALRTIARHMERFADSLDPDLQRPDLHGKDGSRRGE